MAAAVTLPQRIGNELYKVAFPIYRPLYSVFKRYSDRSECRVLADIIRPGDCVVDGGANIGIYSTFLLRVVGESGWVHSFEPDVANFSRLRAALGTRRNTRLNQLALADRSGESILYVSPNLNVDHRTYQSKDEPREEITIQSIRLDDYFQPNERIDFIKLDIQGFEMHALRGASRVLADNPQVKLLLEFWPYGLRKAHSSAEELVAFLRDREFKIACIDQHGLTPFQMGAIKHDPSSYLNLFCCNGHVSN